MSIRSCDFCSTVVADHFGTASSWGDDERVVETICVDCALQDEGDADVCDGCGWEAMSPAHLATYRVNIGHLEGTIRLCLDCAPPDESTHWVKKPPDGVRTE